MYLTNFICHWQFVRDNNKYVEENKLKVALISPISSPEVSPINEDFKNGLAYKKDQIFSQQEILSPEHMVREKFIDVWVYFVYPPSYLSLWSEIFKFSICYLHASRVCKLLFVVYCFIKSYISNFWYLLVDSFYWNMFLPFLIDCTVTVIMRLSDYSEYKSQDGWWGIKAWKLHPVE